MSYHFNYVIPWERQNQNNKKISGGWGGRDKQWMFMAVKLLHGVCHRMCDTQWTSMWAVDFGDLGASVGTHPPQELHCSRGLLTMGEAVYVQGPGKLCAFC